MPPPDKLPVLVLTGFLGSGKTTLLNHLLTHWPRSAVLINEFGAAAVDQRLIERQDVSMTVLAGGCLCCQVRGALAPTLKNLWLAWSAGRPFERLLIETSGAASPGPLLDVLLRERWLAPRVALQGVAATLAVPAALEQLARFPEAQAQAAWADVLVLTQADLAGAAELAALEARLAALAPGAPRLKAEFGRLDPAALLAAARPGPRFAPAALPAHDFHSFSLRLERPLPWARLRVGLEDLLGRGGLLRVKGVVYLEEGGAVAVQGAGGRLYPPAPLAPRAGDDGAGRLVFIGAGPPDALAAAARAALGL